MELGRSHNKNYTALIDGDLIAYRVAWTTEKEELGIALYRTDEMINNIIESTGADEAIIFLSDSENNFRLKIFPEYKANRKKEKPIWLNEIKEHLYVYHYAELAVGQEADDALGIAQDKFVDPEDCKTIICSIDKDMHQIPGHHYNFVKQQGYFITHEEALKHFYIQLLMGDKIDNITGIPGIGIKKAEKILNESTRELCTSISQYHDRVYDSYRKYYGEDAEKQMLLWGQLLKIRTKEGEIWTFPTSDSQKQSEETKS